MNQVLSVKIPKKSKLFVSERENVARGSVLAEGKAEVKRETISVAKSLKIDTGKFFNTLVKKVGDKVKKGEVLAKKSGILGSKILKSPIDGYLVEISQVLGEVVVEEKAEKEIVKSPILGKIRKIEGRRIEIEFSGTVFQGKKGRGKKASGKLLVLPEEPSVLDLTEEIGGKILACQTFSDSVLAKAWALKALGLAGCNFSASYLNLPYLVLKKKDIKTLEKYQGREAILEPEKKQLVVLSE